MCWQCINEERMFNDAGLQIIERHINNNESYYSIVVEDAAGIQYETNPNADWLYARSDMLFEQDADGESYLLPAPAAKRGTD